MSQRKSQPQTLRYGPLSFVVCFALACGSSPASAPPIVTGAQKDATTVAVDVGSNPSPAMDAQVQTTDAGFAADQGPGFADAQTPIPDAGFPPVPMDASTVGSDARVSPDAQPAPMDAMVFPDANLPPDAATPDTGIINTDAGVAMNDAGLAMPPVGDVFDPVSRAAQIAAANCAYSARCEPFRFLYEQSDLSQCTIEETAEYRIGFDIYADAITAGHLAFSQMNFDACINALNTSDCELGLDANACSFLTGQRTQAQSCNYSAECSPDQYCSANGVAVCGMCSPRAALQQDCSNDPCVSGSICAQTNTGAAVCVPNYANENAPCGSVTSGFCRGRLQCRDPQGLGASVCVRPAGPGQFCSSNSNATPNCNFAANQACINAACTTINWVTPGNTCAGANGCTSDGICDQNSMICVARPGTNQLCVSNTCAVGNYCDGTICRAKLQSGLTCTDSVQCAGNLSCIGATGNRSCGNPTWQACP